MMKTKRLQYQSSNRRRQATQCNTKDGREALHVCVPTTCSMGDSCFLFSFIGTHIESYGDEENEKIGSLLGGTEKRSKCH